MGIEDSIVLVKSSGDRSDIGTGSVIYQDETASYVLTCAHVVKAVGGKESVKVDGWDAKVIAYGFEPREEGLDLAVLRVEGLRKPALNLWNFPKKGDSCKIYGYYDFDTKRTYRRDRIEGTLERQGFRRINGEDVKDWDLLVTGSDLLKPGCSGAPVLNQQNEVIAVVTHELSNGQKGAAISIEALEKLENWEIDLQPHLYIPRSERNVDYAKLHDLLAAGNWKAADYKTYLMMLQVVGREKGDYLRSDELRNFPCTDLKTIDNLWKRYSKGKWGFSVQRQIWQKCGSPTNYSKDWEKFGDCVGWRKNGNWLDYNNLTFNLENSLKGEFPWRIFRSVVGWGAVIFRFEVWDLFSRIETCSL